MITLTDLAKKQVELAIEDEERDDLALRVAIVGRSGGGFQYKMDLVGRDEILDTDRVISQGGFDVLVDSESAPDLEGATIDFVTRLQESGFKFDNPNSAWSDPAAPEVQQVIESRINPSIASHGGFVTLLDVKEGVAYIQMGGGCQGCGMADVTLKHGIEGMIREAVPSISQVLDTTDHAAGTNPYYVG
ncbi:MAG: iron-sulfur cluster assembly accessory protein [Acidobacteria bacterium]|nr:MAG: iron-sulfur cluster assembly accessory protein [Acidobacteriota bacterium]REK00279.1 MAG: iron-sulfur cluster assembly accessory protein [Acidobacteriota bacterium]